MKNEDLLKYKIDIQIENDATFQDVASLVDKPSFLNDVREARKALELKKPLKWEGEAWIYFHAEWLDKNQDKRVIVENLADQLSQKYNRPTYKDMIIQAILYGVVTDFNAPLVAIIHENTKFRHPRIAIFPEERTTDKEIRDALKVVKRLYKEGYDRSGFGTSIKHFEPLKAQDIIRKKREWYWKKIENPRITFEKIAEDWNIEHPEDIGMYDVDRVIKGIKDYESLITTPK